MAVGGSTLFPRQGLAASAFLGPATLAVVLLLVAPLSLLGRYSLNQYSQTELMVEAVTPENYIRFFTDPFYLDVMRTTVTVALLSTALCVVLGVPLAWFLARMEGRWKAVCMLAIVLPLFIGSTVRTVGWMILFARGGVLDLASTSLIGERTDLMSTATAVVIGILSFNLPYLVLTVQGVFESINPYFEQAAQGLGAAPARAFWRVVWPLALPGITIGAVLCFVLSMNAYATPVLLGGPRFHMMAPLLFWEFGTNNNWPFAAALAFILMATTLALTMLANLLIPRRYRA
ncbi:ABC transporter permease [Rhodovastum atsumiense]|uniref:ABC transporter permease n=1 Tax=Rhodovastum atsumiense TaxID=504468 RepID=UPI001EF0A8AE|nr:ABC transporter permease [Rhodovastum atsumiense]CAH2598935.1 ABC transporter permease [Rhodovastum atsumiense]